MKPEKTKMINDSIESAEQNIEKIGTHKKDSQTFLALANEHEILRMAKQLLDPIWNEVPVLLARLQCRKEARAFYETLLK